MSEEPKKRSRFDQTEPKRSRFDRRSRSPSERKPAEGRRSRSPVAKPKSVDASAAAAAAAARINATLQARLAEAPPSQSSSTVVRVQKRSNDVAEVTSQIYTQGGDYIKDIEINDLRNRYLLTKGSTQKMVIITPSAATNQSLPCLAECLPTCQTQSSTNAAAHTSSICIC